MFSEVQYLNYTVKQVYTFIKQLWVKSMLIKYTFVISDSYEIFWAVCVQNGILYGSDYRIQTNL